MPFPLAHPAAVLPLRRFCGRYLSFAALLIGSMSPDFTYAIDDLNKFSRTLVQIFGSRVEGLQYVKEAWDWDDFAHTFLGGFIICVPLGYVVLRIFESLRGVLVKKLPNPHRDALLPFCTAPACSVKAALLSLVLGITLHVFWDWFTNDFRWLARNWQFLNEPLLGDMPAYRVFWWISSLGGMAALAMSYLSFLRRDKRQLIDFNRAEFPYYRRWLVIVIVAAAAALPASLYFTPFGLAPDQLYAFFHRFAGFCMVTLVLVVGTLTLFDKFKDRRT